jgi:hypothetical protein
MHNTKKCLARIVHARQVKKIQVLWNASSVQNKRRLCFSKLLFKVYLASDVFTHRITKPQLFISTLFARNSSN